MMTHIRGSTQQVLVKEKSHVGLCAIAVHKPCNILHAKGWEGDNIEVACLLVFSYPHNQYLE